MSLKTVRLGSANVTRLVIGGNPFSGFSHQGPQRDLDMRRYYTVARIKEALHKAEAAGINTVFARTDAHVLRLLEEYWNEGGRIQWFAQTASEQEDFLYSIDKAKEYGAAGCYLHGGQVDYFFKHDLTDNFRQALARMREHGLAAGFAGHTTAPHEWIRDNLAPDFQMCCYYNPSKRDDAPGHVSTKHEKWDPAHRDQMAGFIRTLKTPAVHYKVFAGGNRPARESLAYAAGVMRPTDVMLLGFHLGDDPDLIAKTVKMFEEIVEKA